VAASAPPQDAPGQSSPRAELNDYRLCRRFRRANLLLFFLHLVSAAVTAYLARDAGKARVFNCFVEPTNLEEDKFYESGSYNCTQDGHVNVRVLVIIEVVWTTSAHLLYFMKPGWFYSWVTCMNLINFWVEYSVSATLIFLVVQTMVGLVQPWMYVQNSLLLVGMMFLPIYSVMDTSMRKITAAFSQGFIYFALMYPLAHQVGLARQKTEMPDIAVAMFSMLLILYSSFPAAYAYAQYAKWSNARLGSVMLVLSATSKFILRALIVVAVSR
jgi:hypothetical protein